MGLRVGCPSGIGDASWWWSKLYGVRDQIDAVLIADGWPLRTSDYMRACWTPEERAEPRRTDREGNPPAFVEGAGYGTFRYSEILVSQSALGLSAEHAINGQPAFTWADVLSRCEGHTEILLEPNRHLELGRPLHTWLPDLETHYHYPLYTYPAAGTHMGQVLGNLRVMSNCSAGDTPLVGISCASYRGAKDWKTWGAPEWCAFLEQIMLMGWQPVIIGGYWDDLSHSVAATLGLPDLVGTTSTDHMIEMLRRLDAYIGFSSGLGVVRTVLDKPAFSLWPDFQKELSTAWAPPAMLRTGRYVAAPYRDPVIDSFPVARRFLELCGEEVAREKAQQRQSWQEEARQEKEGLAQQRVLNNHGDS